MFLSPSTEAIFAISLCCSNKGHYSDRKYVTLLTGTLVCLIFAFQLYATGFNLLIIYVHLLLRKYVEYVIPLVISFFLRQNYGTCSFYFFDPENTNFKLKENYFKASILFILQNARYRNKIVIYCLSCGPHNSANSC